MNSTHEMVVPLWNLTCCFSCFCYILRSMLHTSVLCWASGNCILLTFSMYHSSADSYQWPISWWVRHVGMLIKRMTQMRIRFEHVFKWFAIFMRLKWPISDQPFQRQKTIICDEAFEEPLRSLGREKALLLKCVSFVLLAELFLPLWKLPEVHFVVRWCFRVVDKG